MDMALDNVLCTKMTNDKEKEDGTPFAALKARGGGGPIVPWCVEAILRELVGEHTGLG